MVTYLNALIKWIQAMCVSVVQVRRLVIEGSGKRQIKYEIASHVTQLFSVYIYINLD